MNARIIPPHLRFEQAVLFGYTGRIELRPYLDWLKTLPCDTCGRGPGDGMHPIDPSHINGFKGMGTKSPDPFAIPECRPCHEAYEAKGKGYAEERIYRAAFYLLRAIYEGRLKWTSV